MTNVTTTLGKMEGETIGEGGRDNRGRREGRERKRWKNIKCAAEKVLITMNLVNMS